MEYLLVHLQCNRCKESFQIDVENAPMLLPGVGDYFTSSQDVFHLLGITNPVHRCTYSQIGGMSLIGIDLLDDKNSGMEPQLGSKTA